MDTKRMETAVDLAASLAQFCTTALTQPAKAVTHALAAGEGVINSLGRKVEVGSADKRFRDSVWNSNPGYKLLMNSYLAWSGSVTKWVDSLDVPARDKLRAKLVSSLVTDALAPTNSLLGNPTAMKATLDQGGKNVLAGVRSFLQDMMTNNGLPSMVDKSKFALGRNLGLSPGKVVYAEDHLELIQYAPQTAQVHKTPVFIVPPQINKFYIWDLSPGRSIVEYLVGQGHQVFLVSWRNPTAEQADWGLESYVEALDRATAVACEISGSPELNLVGACSGGITAALLIALWGARGDKRAGCFSLLVANIDLEDGQGSAMGLFANLETLELARMFSQSKGVLEGRDLERAFAWLRPNDLIWAYWVNNYLLGREPPAFDILFWNSDTTNLPAALHGDLLRLLEAGGMTAKRGPTIAGYELNLSHITCDAYVVGGETDHITPWEGCYLTTQGLGGNWDFVLCQSGHIQTLINPPDNAKARFLTNPGKHASAEEFLAGAETHSGSWWPHWLSWLNAHGGSKGVAPQTLGSQRHQPVMDAPGSYALAAV